MDTMRQTHDATGTESVGQTRRGLLKCAMWAGTGILWTVSGGIPKAIGLGSGEALAAPAGFGFVQISDSHIGFKGQANPDPNSTLQQALAQVAALPNKPALMLHTGDVTHLSKPEQFDTAAQIMQTARLDTLYVPGEHDVIGDGGKQFFTRFGTKGAAEGGWYSFDHGGVHFVALVNVLNFSLGTGGAFGKEQIDWLDSDLKGRSASTPIVVMAHIPMWPVYPQWGWTTADAGQALAPLKRFGSVTVLNGHIHQVVQKVEDRATFHTALSTAFPQAPAGQGPAPGPLKVSADKLKSMLGVRDVEFQPATGFAVVDHPLAA